MSPHGFDIVRRGYDRDQVDAYVTALSGPTPPTEPPAFQLVRRGYDRDQVDACIKGLQEQLSQG